MDASINFITQYAYFFGILLLIGIAIWIFRPSTKPPYPADAYLLIYGNKKK